MTYSPTWKSQEPQSALFKRCISGVSQSTCHRDSICISSKYLASSYLEKEGFILAHSLRGQFTTVRKVWGQAWEAAGHICVQSVGREERSGLKMWFGVDGVRQSWYGSNQAEGHQLMFSVALRLDTWIASGCRTDAGLEATGRDFSKRSPGRGLRKAPCTPLVLVFPAQRIPASIPPSYCPWCTLWISVLSGSPCDLLCCLGTTPASWVSKNTSLYI